ncbi:glutamine-hydrolyzing carbamoyl-phosphate synthase small subunit [Caminibacter mediatlanticus TB-2]|uniref:Carbamoyl phosphate synthase small chain n=1 Tax=Caminibacter mediatlanticus TB-2 TaxID=391592 RepID=A0ABX5V613_9BACT|nr:glutamine-hydrolyzing carbamoyl-phosphate synthase small subunit [Caminibacter mediatlanticus]QCT93683.1 glutamine-hydrolyzing carbamoyl-phosphate synthase small subunit [Caminibacter mediatlanticus TB-2]
MKVSILLENGMFFEASSFGSEGTAVGEIVFNTSMTGYQEIITDPSYAGQFVVFTMPEIGNVGVNKDDMESKKAHLKGVIVREYIDDFSNFRGERSLGDFLKDEGIIGISEIDTRFLTKTIRKEGAMMMVASTEIHDKDELEKILKNSPRIEEIDYIKEVTTKKEYIHPHGAWNSKEFKYNPKKTDKKIAVLDFGVKRNILNELTEAGMECLVLPANTEAEKITKMYENGEIGGVFLSNGPGDPLILKDIHEKIKKLLKAKIPMFGICLGHQLLSISHGYPTFKLKFGHHGGNHPVKNNLNKKPVVEITAQNHNYNVPEGIKEIAEVTHINLFDNTIEGVKYKNKPVFSVQHHPEASPGPHDSKYIFKEFYNIVK